MNAKSVTCVCRATANVETDYSKHVKLRQVDDGFESILFFLHFFAMSFCAISISSTII